MTHPFGRGALEIRDGMESCLDGPDMESAGAITVGRGDERFQSFAVRGAHPAKVPLEMPCGHQVGQHRLIEQRRVHVRGSTRRQQRFAEVGGHDEKTKPQRREERLAEAADVDHASVGVETMQTRHRPRAVPKLAVVVVFDDPGARGARPFHERQPARQAHRHTERKLMRWRDVHKARIARARHARLDIQPMFIDRHRHDAGSRTQQRASRAEVTGFLQPCFVSGIEHEMADLLQAALRARHDDNLIGAAARAARRLDMVGDRFSKSDEPGRIAVIELRERDRPQTPIDELRPEPKGKQVQRGCSEAERSRRSRKSPRR